MCRSAAEGGRRCPACSDDDGRAAHNERRRHNRAVRRALVAWAREEGYDAATVALVSSSSPSAAKKWGREHDAPEKAFVEPEEVQLRLRLEPVPRRTVLGDPVAFGFDRADKTRYTPFGITQEKWIAEYDEWVDDLDGDEHEALVSYTGPHGADINSELRSTDDDEYELDDETEVDVDLLWQALDQAPRSSKPRTVIRGVSAPYGTEGKASDWARRMFPVGATWYDKGFLSTTRSPGTAASFGSDQERGVVFELRSRGGACVARVSAHPNELEYMFPPRTRWRVIGHADSVGYSYSGPAAATPASMHRPVVFLVDEKDLDEVGPEASAAAQGWDSTS